MGRINAKCPPGKVRRQDDVHHYSGERKLAGSVQSVHLGKSGGRMTHIRLESGFRKWVGSV
ncbi:hypothetical protein FA13DRAFT_1732263 [Coprinellus micaceus]|uniref:Uncharacterized protein n=1 Tax=Coprinellus micaceus TaxID=71717 RepID=A0A4Y7TCT9_COPMI|nr:hypothetical protein FA13DRAFT_1732263 [Coprinellus micaceus]